MEELGAPVLLHPCPCHDGGTAVEHGNLQHAAHVLVVIVVVLVLAAVAVVVVVVEE